MTEMLDEFMLAANEFGVFEFRVPPLQKVSSPNGFN
jgi:hypothetical protein